MEVAVVLLTVLCYGLTIFLWWERRTPIFLFALLSGHIGALASPLWGLLYQSSYRANLAVLLSILDLPLPAVIFVASAWFYTLPGLLVFYLHSNRWWTPGYVVGLVTWGIFIFYHTIIESLGLRTGTWSYAQVGALPFGLSHALVSTLMAALISLLHLYGLLLIRRFSWPSMLLVLLPATLLASLFVRGVLGAPFWVVLIFSSGDWIVQVGVVCTLTLIIWAVHIVVHGLSRLD